MVSTESPSGEPLVAARDASYARAGYRSFEHVTFQALAGEATVLVATELASVRDVLLAIAGAVVPTSGSLVVCGQERARRRRLLRAVPMTVGVGVVSGYADQEPSATVGEALAQELALRRAPAGLSPVLEALARFGLATHVDQRGAALDAAARIRLSAARAAARRPQVAVVDASDAFCRGLAACDGARIIQELACLAREDGMAMVVGTCDPALVRGADASVPLDIDSAEALARLETAGGADAAAGE